MRMAAYKLVLIRHGESCWNQENRFCGWFDADLSETGEQEAKRGGQALKGIGRPNLTRLPLGHWIRRLQAYATPVRRANRLSNTLRHSRATEGETVAEQSGWVIVSLNGSCVYLDK